MNVEINNPLKNPTLDKYLEARRDLKPGSEDFMQCMNVIAREIALEGKFLAPIKAAPEAVDMKPNGTGRLKEGNSFSFVQLTAPDGTQFFPAFTNWMEVRKGDMFLSEDTMCLTLTFDDYMTIVEDDAGVVVNPFSDNVIFPNEGLKHMAGMKAKELSQKAGK